MFIKLLFYKETALYIFACFLIYRSSDHTDMVDFFCDFNKNILPFAIPNA